MKFAMMAVLLAALLAACATTPAAPLIADVAPVALPAYQSDRGIMRASSEAEYNEAGADSRFVLEQFHYPSDGMSAGAYLYRPAARAAHMPVVVFNRGGWVREDFGPETLTQMRHLAQAGFVVVAPFLRGSNGTEGQDELGGADVNDVMNIVPALRGLAYIDPDRIFLYGESRGALMTFEALRDGFPARAAVVYGSWGDLEALIGPEGAQREAAPMIWPDIEQRRAEIVERRSALHWIDRLNAPILQMHGGEDGDIPITEARRIDAALTAAGKTHDFIVFEGAHHTLSEVAAERDAAAIAWFNRFDAH